MDYYCDLINEQGIGRIECKVVVASPDVRRHLLHVGPFGNHVQFRVHSPDVQTACRGLIERVFLHFEEHEGRKVLVPPFKPTQKAVDRLLGGSARKLVDLFTPVRKLTPEEFLSPLPSRKKARYSKAYESLQSRPIVPKDAFLSTFVKAEKLNVTAKPDPSPRVIQPRDARYCFEVGLYIKGMEHMIYQAIDQLFGARTVMKGLNADRRGAAFADARRRFCDAVFVGLDASRFDQHVSPALLKLEHWVYLQAYNDPYFKKLLRMQLRNRGYVRTPDGTIKYTVHGSRMSGDMNTSLGNVLLMCLMVHAYMESVGLSVNSYRLLNDGDDCVLVLERSDLAKLDTLPEWFGGVGMIMKVEEPVSELEHVEFCQSHPIEVTEGVWRMVRDPRTVLSKDLCVVKPIHTEGAYNRQRYSIGECGLSLAGDVPVYWSFYQMMGRGVCLSRKARRTFRRSGPETGMDYLALGMNRKCTEPTSTCRVSFWKAFGMTPGEQVALEAQYNRITPEWRKPEIVYHVGDIYRCF